MELPVGHTLNNRFRVIRLLGQGGMASVYYAHDPVLNRYVAIKQMLSEPEASEHAAEQMRKQFLREAQVLASLHHPNLPRVTDYFVDSDLHYLVMDYIEGQSLYDLLVANKQGFSEGVVLDWADELLSALEYIHKHNVIHRDIKPANIRRTTDGRIFLVDFGLAKPYNISDPRTMTMFHGLGTPEYAPPEQYDPAAHTDQRSDIYALGATLYHLLTGQAPISATRRTSDPEAFRSLRQSKTAIAIAVEQVILRAMEIERAKRFASATEMRAALNAARRGVALAPTPVAVAALGTPPAAAAVQRPRRRTLLYAGVPVLLLLALLTGFALRPPDSPDGNATLSPTPTATLPGAASVTPTLTVTLTSTDTTTSLPDSTLPMTTTAGTSEMTPTSAPTQVKVKPVNTAPPAATLQPVATQNPQPKSTAAPPVAPKPTKVVVPPGQIKKTPKK